MSELTLVGSPEAKVISLAAKTNEAAIQDFFAYYHKHTNPVILGFLDLLYQEYLNTPAWQYASIKDKAVTEFNYQLLRKFLQKVKP